MMRRRLKRLEELLPVAPTVASADELKHVLRNMAPAERANVRTMLSGRRVVEDAALLCELRQVGWRLLFTGAWELAPEICNCTNDLCQFNLRRFAIAVQLAEGLSELPDDQIPDEPPEALRSAVTGTFFTARGYSWRDGYAALEAVQEYETSLRH